MEELKKRFRAQMKGRLFWKCGQYAELGGDGRLGLTAIDFLYKRALAQNRITWEAFMVWHLRMLKQKAYDAALAGLKKLRLVPDTRDWL
jgi:hypothetical protein